MTATRFASTALLTLVLAPLAILPAETRGQTGGAAGRDRASIEDPQLSPDGRTLAFVNATSDRAHGRQSQIHRLDVAGGRATSITPGLARAWSPRWSPDGRRLAFLASREHDGPPQIHVLEIESGAWRQVTRHPTPPGDLIWAPDSRLVFFAAADATSDERRHLAVVDLDGVTTQITFGAYAISEYALSLSGGTIAMTRAPSTQAGASRERDVWVMDANGGNAHRLTTGAAFARLPQVSPDGASVAFLAPRPQGSRGPAERTVFLVPRRGGTPRPLLLDAPVSVRDARWLSDGRLAIVTERDGAVQLAEADVATGRTEVRTPHLPAVGHWTVQPRTGTQVFTVAAPTGGMEIALMPLGGPMRRVPIRP